jgi:predicted phage-related endonuclease
VQSILEQEAPDEYMLQLQTGLLVTGRKWIDYISYSAGLPMATMRVYPDDETHIAIVEAAFIFEQKINRLHERYLEMLADTNYKLIPTERKIDEEIVV